MINGTIETVNSYPLGSGNIYYVMQTTNTLYSDFVRTHNRKYRNSATTSAVYSDIQSALDATVANRNDYVVVMPDSSDYDITEALTMTKARVHLICPAGLGTYGMGMNMARIHQNTAATAIITVTGDTTEIAGLFFKGYSGADIITLSSTRWHNLIHDNFFGLSATASSSNTALAGTGAVSHPSIHHNFFTNYSPGAVTGTDNDVAAFIGLTSASSTRGLICDNLFTTGVNTAVAAGISVAGLEFFILRNYMFESPAFGSSQAGTFTLGISTSAGCFVSDNRIGIGTPANGVSGGTADQSYVTNYEGTSGGTLLT